MNLKYIILAIVIILAVCISIKYSQLDLSIEESIEKFKSYNLIIQYSIVLFLLFLQAIITGFPTIVITLAVAKVYGFWWGILINITSQFILAICVFLFFKYLFSGTIVDLSRIKKLEALKEKYGAYTVIVARIFPFFGFDLVNMGLAMLQVRNRDYIIGTIIGLLFWIPIQTYIGVKLL